MFPIPPDSEPLDPDILLLFAELENTDMVTALQWWDEHAPPEWAGALDNG